MRAQFNGLFDLIQTIPVGPAGRAGVNAAVVDAVTTGNPGENAAAAVGLTGQTLHFSFTLPRGDVGATGATGGPATASVFFDGGSVRFSFGIPSGLDGLQGPTGATGAIGPAFTSFVVDSVTTLAPSQPATVVATFDGTSVRFAFGIPQGQQENTASTAARGRRESQARPAKSTPPSLS